MHPPACRVVFSISAGSGTEPRKKDDQDQRDENEKRAQTGREVEHLRAPAGRCDEVCYHSDLKRTMSAVNARQLWLLPVCGGRINAV